MDLVDLDQTEGKQVDGRSDLYSLGCVLYELATGEPPFRAEWPAIMYQHLTKAASSTRALRADIPVQLDKLILELLAKNPDDRPVTASRVATALRAIQQRQRSPAQQQSTRNQAVRRSASSPAIGSQLALRYAVRSDVGLVREGNEDSAYAGPHLLAVADGIGGNAAGEVASALTIASMAELDSEQGDADMLKALSSAVVTINARLREKITANPAVKSMATTLTALLWDDGHAAVCHIGHSRGYLLRDGELFRFTRDHTLVQSLVDEGRISADDVATHPQRSVLLRALDGRSTAEPDLSVHDGLAGFRYLLCSDGLSGVISDETLRDILSSIEDPGAAASRLIDLAIRSGGPDNITCIVADVVDTARTRLVLTTSPVLAGAAASLGDLRLADRNGSLGGFEDRHEEQVPAAQTGKRPIADDLDPTMTATAIRPIGAPASPDPGQSVAIQAGLVPPQPRRLRYSAPSVAGGKYVENSRGSAAGDDYSRVGRNDLCPCGSGRKYKRCHGDPRMRPYS